MNLVFNSQTYERDDDGTPLCIELQYRFLFPFSLDFRQPDLRRILRFKKYEATAQRVGLQYHLEVIEESHIVKLLADMDRQRGITG